VLDLAILLCRTKLYFREAYKYKKLYDESNPRIDRIALQGGALDVAVCTGNEMIDEDIRMLGDAFSRDDELLSERLKRLSAILKEMGC
jgi:hypothetical protein